MIYPSNYETKLGFVKIKELLNESCLSTLGRENVDNIQFVKSYKEVEQLLLQTSELKSIIQFDDKFNFSNFSDIRPYLKHIRIEGTLIEEENLFELRKGLVNLRSVLMFFANEENIKKYPTIGAFASQYAFFPEVEEGINRILDKFGKIKDNASSELSSIRRNILSKKSEIVRKASAILQKAKASGLVDKDINLAIRNDRSVIPVPSANKRKFKGLILDESATGKTVFIEPADIVEANNDIKELEYQERREIRRILIAKADDLRPFADELIGSYEFLGVLDFIRAKAKLAIRLNALKPILSKHPRVEWRTAVHPLLFLSHAAIGKTVVPLDISLDRDNRILLISGPNAGGKSVCLKTIGLLQYMLQCGLLVPVKEDSVFGIFNNIFIDIGDEQSIENDLSTYSSHLMNMKSFTKFADGKTLLMIDEFGTGTEPMLGGAIAEAVLGDLNNKKAFGVITTHYTNLKHYASATENIFNGAMLYDTAEMRPLFKLCVGEPGSSFAFEIARNIGLSENILTTAADIIGKDNINYDKNLKDILRDKRYWEKKRQNIRKIEKNIEEQSEQFSEFKDDVSKIRKQIIREAKAEASRIIADSNKVVERTVKGIVESNAEKEKTKALRKELQAFKDGLTDSSTDSRVEIDLKLKKKIQIKKKTPISPIEKRDIVAGDKVRMKGQILPGEVVSVKKKKAEVVFGLIKSFVELNRLELVTEKEYKNFNKPKKSVISVDGSFDKVTSFKHEIDLRGVRADEAMDKISRYIDDAIMCNATEVRVMHGKGTGALRLMIREYLGTLDYVTSFRDEHPDFGGSGVTKVVF